MPEIILKNVTKRWGKFVGVDNLNMVIKDRGFVTLLGHLVVVKLQLFV